ncbi:MAG TPA: hypothetical protein VFR06_09600 [Gallionellaceae bacterium]|nr:hypothetical protein [Gallionellaceae bacterium]
MRKKNNGTRRGSWGDTGYGSPANELPGQNSTALYPKPASSIGVQVIAPGVTSQPDIRYHRRMSPLSRSLLFSAFAFGWTCCTFPANALESALDLRESYAQKVDRQLLVPQEEQRLYAGLLANALQQRGLQGLPAQYLLLVDRSDAVQAIFLFWLNADGKLELIGASPASTSVRGGFEHFETPLGVFDHSAANLDFRAEGSKNSKGIRGYGAKGLRIFDFGWVRAGKTWRRGVGEMRLQVHATDPDYLEPRLGSVQSKGCIRIPATLNRFIDHYGILDEGYERAAAQGKRPWLLRAEREATPWSGRYLVIVDSERSSRPDWSPAPVIQPHARIKKAPVHTSSEPLPVSSPVPAPARTPPS